MSVSGSPWDIRTEVENIVRDEWARVHSALIGYVRDFELAEDVLQDAIVAALRHWTEDGIPRSPRAWLLQTARRKAIDRFRRSANFDAKRAEYEVLLALDRQSRPDDVDETIPDERLRLVFTCCHPALAEQARVALTLRTLGGLTTPEIASAFLVSEETMAQRIVRAKRKIKIANIPYSVPEPSQLPERLGSVLSVIYLIFNEGYAATSGDHTTRSDLCREAIRICRVLRDLMQGEPEIAGLLALMLLHDSRRPARVNDAGVMETLENQDRRLWNREQISDGLGILRQALALGRIGPYQIQAAISAVHSEAGSHGATDWNEIALLYGKLYALQPSPIVLLNAAVALSFSLSAEAGLGALEDLEQSGELHGYQPYHAARADLSRRAGRRETAKAEYRKAIDLSRNTSQRNFLQNRLSELGG